MQESCSNDLTPTDSPTSSNHNIGASVRAARALHAAPHRAQHYTQFAILRNAIYDKPAQILLLFLIFIMSRQYMKKDN